MTSPTTQAAEVNHASKVWFVSKRRRFDGLADNSYRLLCFIRSDASCTRPQLDTFGGKMEALDHGYYPLANCANREVSEELELPNAWLRKLQQCLATNPWGHRKLELTLRGQTHAVSHWFVEVDSSYVPTLTTGGRQESLSCSLKWRSPQTVIENLSKFRFAKPIVAMLQQYFGL